MFPAGSTRTLTATALLALAAGAPALAQQASTADIDRMMAVIEAQQQQIDAMRAELNALKAERTAAAAPRPATAPVTLAAAPAAALPPTANEDDRTEAQMVAEGFTWRDSSGRSLTLSGQINPAFNVVDDGISTDVFIVDNDTSGTRFRLDADAPLGETSLGATLEIGASPNNSYDVSQLEVADRRRLQRPPRRGDVPQRPLRPAAARQGLERRRRHRRIRPVAGGGADHVRGRRRHRRRHHLHRRNRTRELGTADDPVFLTVGDAFFDFDGDRLARIRYDSPMFGPLQGSASYGQDDQWAAAVTLGGDYGDWSGWTLGDFTAARRGLGLQPRGRQRRLRLRRLRLGPARSDRAQPDALDRRPEARRGRRSFEPLRQARLGHRVLAARPDRLRHRLHQGREHQQRRRRRDILRDRGGAEDRPLQHRPLQPAALVRT